MFIYLLLAFIVPNSVPIFSDVKFSYLALLQDKNITCVLPANACCTVFLAGDHVNNVSYFPFMSIKKVVCILREDYYVIIWLIVTCTIARQKYHVRFTGKCMLYSVCQLPPNSPFFSFLK
jgi:hypothetical protein